MSRKRTSRGPDWAIEPRPTDPAPRIRRRARGTLLVHPDFPSALLGNRRALTVYLPPGYTAESERRYPVLYLHDGQNLFDPAAAAFGVSWQAHATADRLIARRRIEPIIMVGIANTPDRIDEYTFHHDPARKAGGRGRFYARFVLDEVKPFIDATYRTRPGREHTAIAGSSLGGLVSLTMAWDDHDRFALCGVLSPSLWWCRERVLRDLGRRPAWMRSVRFWLDVGAREGAQPAEQWANVLRARRLVEIFDAAGLLPGPDYYYAEVADGEHSEAAWAARFDRVLLYFFGRRDSALPGQGATG